MSKRELGFPLHMLGCVPCEVGGTSAPEITWFCLYLSFSWLHNNKRALLTYLCQAGPSLHHSLIYIYIRLSCSLEINHFNNLKKRQPSPNMRIQSVRAVKHYKSQLIQSSAYQKLWKLSGKFIMLPLRS